MVLDLSQGPVCQQGPSVTRLVREQGIGDALRGLAVAIRSGSSASGPTRCDNRLGYPFGIGWWRETVPAEFDKFSPLGFIAEGHARDGVKKCLLLDTPGVGGNYLGMRFEPYHIQKAHGLDEFNAAEGQS